MATYSDRGTYRVTLSKGVTSINNTSQSLIYRAPDDEKHAYTIFTLESLQSVNNNRLDTQFRDRNNLTLFTFGAATFGSPTLGANVAFPVFFRGNGADVTLAANAPLQRLCNINGDVALQTGTSATVFTQSILLFNLEYIYAQGFTSGGTLRWHSRSFYTA